MQLFLQVSRKVDYALRAMIYLASLPPGTREPLQEVARRNSIPKDFLAKILKVLADGGLVVATRGAHGGVAIGRSPGEISFLDVIEAVEGPVTLNLCLSDARDACAIASHCTMQSVWRRGQERMLDVYRSTMLADLTGKLPLPVQLSASAASADQTATDELDGADAPEGSDVVADVAEDAPGYGA